MNFLKVFIFSYQKCVIFLIKENVKDEKSSGFFYKTFYLGPFMEVIYKLSKEKKPQWNTKSSTVYT